MRRILAIAWLNLVQIARDRSELVAIVVLPLMLTWVFGAAFGGSTGNGTIVVPVADLDRSVYSRAVVLAVEDARATEVRRVSEALARKLVEDGESSVAVIVPAGFGERIEAFAHGRCALPDIGRRFVELGLAGAESEQRG